MTALKVGQSPGSTPQPGRNQGSGASAGTTQASWAGPQGRGQTLPARSLANNGSRLTIHPEQDFQGRG